MRKLYVLGAAGVCAGLFGWSTLSSSQEKELPKETQAPCAATEKPDCAATQEEVSLSLEGTDDEVWDDFEETSISKQRDFIVPEKPDPVCVTRIKDDKGQEKIEATYKIQNESPDGERASANAHVTVTVDPDGEEHVSAGIGFSRTW